MLTDSHCHLNAPQLFPDRPKHVQDFAEVGGVGLSIIGTNLEDSKVAVEICRDTLAGSPKLGGASNTEDLMIGATIGIHPEFASQVTVDEAVQGLEQMLEADKENRLQGKPIIIGIGEIGTDLHREEYRPFHQQQKELFQAQCELAIKYDLPVIIHSRDDFEGTMGVLRSVIANQKTINASEAKQSTFKIYFHCRGYGPEELGIVNSEFGNNAHPTSNNITTSNLELLTSNLFIGFCGNITYPKAQALRDSFQYCLNQNVSFVFETDAPFLSAQAVRGSINAPAQIIYTYDYIAEYYQITIDNLKRMTRKHFMSLYFPDVQEK